MSGGERRTEKLIKLKRNCAACDSRVMERRGVAKIKMASMAIAAPEL